MKKIISAIVLLMVVNMMMGQTTERTNTTNIAVLSADTCIFISSGGTYIIADDVNYVQSINTVGSGVIATIQGTSYSNLTYFTEIKLEREGIGLTSNPTVPITLNFCNKKTPKQPLESCNVKVKVCFANGNERMTGGPKRVRPSTATIPPTFMIAQAPTIIAYVERQQLVHSDKVLINGQDSLILEMNPNNYYYGAGMSFPIMNPRKQGLYLQTDINLLGGKRGYNIRNLNTNTVDSSFSRTRVKAETPLLIGYKLRPLSIYTGIIPSIPIYTEKYKLFEKAGESAHLDYCFGAAVQWKRLHLTAMYRGNFYQQDEIVSLNNTMHKIPFIANSISIGVGYLLQKQSK